MLIYIGGAIWAIGFIFMLIGILYKKRWSLIIGCILMIISTGICKVEQGHIN